MAVQQSQIKKRFSFDVSAANYLNSKLFINPIAKVIGF